MCDPVITPHCPKNNLNIPANTKPVMVGADVTAFFVHCTAHSRWNRYTLETEVGHIPLHPLQLCHNSFWLFKKKKN